MNRRRSILLVSVLAVAFVAGRGTNITPTPPSEPAPSFANTETPPANSVADVDPSETPRSIYQASYQNPAAVFDPFLRHYEETGHLPSIAIYGLFSNWARQDATRAFAALQHLPAEATVGSIARDAFFDGVFFREPDRAKRFLDEAIADADWTWSGGSWLHRDPAHGCKLLGSIRRCALQDFMLSGRFGVRISLANRWGATAPLDALAWANARPRNARDTRHAVYMGWARADVHAAKDFLVEHRQDSRVQELLHPVAWQLIEQDPVEGARWVVENSGHRAAETPLWCVVGRLASTNPLEAAKIVENLPEGPAQWGTVGDLVWRWGAPSRDDPSDIESAADWARALPEGQLRREAIEAVAGHWARVGSDPAGAAAFVLGQGFDSFPDQVIEDTARPLAETPPDMAIDFALQIAEPSRQAEILDTVFRAIAWEDPAAAAKRFLPPDESRFPIAVLETVSQVYQRDNPAHAHAWLTSLTGHKTYGEVATALLRIDPRNGTAPGDPDNCQGAPPPP